MTIDSSEPLTDAIRVIGALYNVTLTQVDGSAPDQNRRASGQRASNGPISKPAGSTRTRSQRPAAPKSLRAPAAASRRKSATKAADPGQIRAWAKANGHTVNDRGPLSRTVQAAYVAAQKI